MLAVEYTLNPMSESKQVPQKKESICQWSKDILSKLRSGRISKAEFELECVYKALETGINHLEPQGMPCARDVLPEVERICKERGIADNDKSFRREIQNALAEKYQKDNAWRIQQAKAMNYANYVKLKDMYQVLTWANEKDMALKLKNIISEYELNRGLMFP